MIRLYRTLCFTATLWIICSCGDSEASRYLNDIESYILERPDSALVALRAIDKEQIGASKDRAKYSLLYAMALDKNYIDTTDVSVIQPAIDYYERTDDAESKMKAFYYLGRIQQNAKESQDAIFSFTKALDFANDVEESYFKIRIHTALSRLYSNKYSVNEALYHIKEAYRYSQTSSDQYAKWFIMSRMARCYARSRLVKEADSVYLAFMNSPILDTTNYATTLFEYAKMLILRKPHDSKKSIEVFNLAKNKFRGRPTKEDLYYHAYALDVNGDAKGADKILHIADSNGGNGIIASCNAKYKIFRRRQNFKEALFYFEKTINNQDSVIISNLRQSIFKTQSEYYMEKADKIEIEKREEKYRLLFIIFALIISVIVAAQLIYYLKRKVDNQKEKIILIQEEIERRMVEIEKNSNEKNTQIINLRKKFLSAYKSQYRLLNNLCATYLLPDRGDSTARIYGEVKRTLSEIVDMSSFPSKLEILVNDELDGIMDKIRAIHPHFTESDYRLISLFIMGFEAKTISLLTNYTVKSVYGKKDRIKKRIANSSSAFKEEILRFLA